jgi:uncharacterized protein
MKVVLDTNIFISGIFWSGDSEKIIYAWGNEEFEIITSSEIIREIVETLMDFKIQLPINILLLWISILSMKSLIVEPQEKINIVKDDPDDDKFIEAAISGKADYIITQDKHLLKIKEFREIKILTPRDFLGIIKKEKI